METKCKYGCISEPPEAYLRNGTRSDWVFVKLFEYVLEWSLKYSFYDFLRVC